MKVYLDNSATTRCSERAKAILIRALTEDYGNPSALHGMGKSAEDYIRDAREKIAATLKVEEKELMFTSGGTESNNMAIIGAALGNPRLGRHIITTEIEHPSVREPFEALKELGYEITYLGVDGEGRISLEELSSAVREDTALVSIMMVNNEIGPWSRWGRPRSGSGRKIRTRCFMWMRSRRMGNSGFIRKSWASTCSP